MNGDANTLVVVACIHLQPAHNASRIAAAIVMPMMATVLGSMWLVTWQITKDVKMMAVAAGRCF